MNHQITGTCSHCKGNIFDDDQHVKMPEGARVKCVVLLNFQRLFDENAAEVRELQVKNLIPPGGSL